MNAQEEKDLGGDPAIREIAFYYEEMVRSNLLELEIESAQGKINLKRANWDAKAPHPLRRKTDFLPASGAASVSEPAAPPASYKAIHSPIIGVFYRASSPQSPPLVKEGDVVPQGSTLCIIEAMKVMNEIKSESRCKVVKILVENAKPVTKGQALFHVEPLA